MGASLAASNAATLFLQRYVDLANDAFLKAVTKDLLGEERIDGGLQSKLADLIDFYVVNPIPADPTGALRAKGALIGELLYQASLVGEGQFFLAASSFLEGMAAGIQVLGKSLFDIDFQDAPDGVNDTLTGVPGQTNLISGDKGQMFGTARGGNDSITGANDAENTLYGDDAVLLGYSSGGDDTLTGGFNSINNLYGDGISLEGRSWGGNDTLKGAPGGPNNNINFMVGDAEKLGENTRAGNDTLIGGPDMAANFMYGDGLYVYVVQGGGPDYLVTQPKCGDDILISGIASNDTMVGDAISSIITLSDGSVVTVDGVGSAVRGRDTFVFAPDNGIDVVLDFQSGFDKLDLTAYGSALNFAALSTVVTGGNLTIPFDENNSITLMGVTGVKPEDLIFAQ